LNKSIIATCGSGITACWISFAASLLGSQVPVYDVRVYYNSIFLNFLQGSWTEFAQYGNKNKLHIGVMSNSNE
jgi:3-mercaptopyruvate sulfurtransferase SseA